MGWSGALSAESYPGGLSGVHDSFCVELKKCFSRADVKVPLDGSVDENLRFVEEPIEIVERDVKKLKAKKRFHLD
ncbi:hypothetical protein Tco_1066214 [Tanacetum coccineum]|uniref:Uncharacterized protein n=1 Tax=Tanacetum coccineum TaxID=301880 RepID=A0ABQ5H9F6_9ASTR